MKEKKRKECDGLAGQLFLINGELESLKQAADNGVISSSDASKLCEQVMALNQVVLGLAANMNALHDLMRDLESRVQEASSAGKEALDRGWGSRIQGRTRKGSRRKDSEN